MPIAIPDARSRGTSFLILEKGIRCFVNSRKTAINNAAKTARHKASSPEDTGMFLTKRPKVPNMVMDVISIKRGFIVFFISCPLNLPMPESLTQSSLYRFGDSVNIPQPLSGIRHIVSAAIIARQRQMRKMRTEIFCLQQIPCSIK